MEALELFLERYDAVQIDFVEQIFTGLTESGAVPAGRRPAGGAADARRPGACPDHAEGGAAGQRAGSHPP